MTDFAEDYQPGDIVTYHRPQNQHSRSHIAIVSDRLGPSGRPMIVHNRGWGPQLEDGLFVDEITGHYRFGAPRPDPGGADGGGPGGAIDCRNPRLRDRRGRRAPRDPRGRGRAAPRSSRLGRTARALSGAPPPRDAVHDLAPRNLDRLGGGARMSASFQHRRAPAATTPRRRPLDRAVTVRTYLDFEKPIAELESKVAELKMLESGDSVSITDEIKKLEQKAHSALIDTYAKLTPWQKTQVARHPERPHCLDYVGALIEEFTPLAGDRYFAEDEAIVGGVGTFRGRSVVVIGHEKGSDTESRIRHNFGMASPEGYRKAVRLMNWPTSSGCR